MKRTTICPSRLHTATLAAALVAAAAPASAQQMAAIPESGVHIVSQGETLWNLAEYYLGDPFLWPEIYRLNPAVIEDPHWIFPGEELRLTGEAGELAVVPPVEPDPGDVVEVTPPQGEMLTPDAAPPPPPPPTSAQASTVFAKNRKRIAQASYTRAADRRRRPPARSQFYAAGFLTERESFPWARMIGIADQSNLSTLRVTSSAMMLSHVRLEAPPEATYRIGDSLLVAFVAAELRTWGEVIYPTGVVEVTQASGREILGKVIMQFNVIEGGQIAVPLEAFRDRADQRTVPIENGMLGSIVAVRDEQPLTDLEDIVFIDLGRGDGVAVGDEFEVLLARGGFADSPDRKIGLIQIVHVRDRTATGFVLEINDIGIGVGSPVQLVRKMPS